MKTRLLLSAVSLLLALFVYFVPNERFPNSADDWSYLLQARLMASGHAYAEDALYDKANPLQRYIGTNCVTDYQGRRFSKYPPGWPLLLSVGSLVGAEWVVAPLLGALLVFLVLGDVERRIGRSWVVRAWLLMALCLFLSYTFQSYRSHTATALCVFAAFLVYEPATSRDSAGRWRLVAAGLLLGYAALVRYVDWLPLALWIAFDLLRRKRILHLVLFAVGFGLLAGVNLLWDTLLSGNPLVTPTALSSAVGPHDHLALSWRGFTVTAIRLGAVLYVFPPVLVVSLLTRRYWLGSRFKTHAVLFLMSAGLYFFYVAAVGGPGPRYLSAYFPFLVVLTVDAWRWLYEQHSKRAPRLWRYAVVLQVVASLVFAGIETRRVYERKDLDRALARVEPGRKIVIMKTGPRGETWADFTRNPPKLESADVLYLGWGDGARLADLVERFPARRLYIYDTTGLHLTDVLAWPRPLSLRTGDTPRKVNVDTIRPERVHLRESCGPGRQRSAASP